MLFEGAFENVGSLEVVVEAVTWQLGRLQLFRRPCFVLRTKAELKPIIDIASEMTLHLLSSLISLYKTNEQIKIRPQEMMYGTYFRYSEWQNSFYPTGSTENGKCIAALPLELHWTYIHVSSNERSPREHENFAILCELQTSVAS